jgi:hypothetical protein
MELGGFSREFNQINEPCHIFPQKQALRWDEKGNKAFVDSSVCKW